MSTGTKVLLIVLVVGGVLVVLCCGGLALLGWFTWREVKQGVSEDSAVVRQRTAEIVNIDIPGDFQPMLSFDMKVPFTDQRMMLWTVYEDKASGSHVAIAQLGDMFNQQNQQQMQVQLEQSLREQGMAQQQAAGPRETFQKEVTIQGKPVSFTFTKSKAQNTGKARLDVIGALPSKGKTVMVMMSLDGEKYDEGRATKILQSIR
jgi:hypothetical protein